MPKFIDLTGMRFAHLVVLGVAERLPGNPNSRWLCNCDCGNNRAVLGINLKTGDTTSCGCVRRQTTAKIGRAMRKHGHTFPSTSATYTSWRCMISRCVAPTDKSYRNYGARGVSVCDRWVESFENFLADMGKRPAGKTIDRIDVNGNYEPGNCRWATPSEQARNRRKKVARQ